MQLQPWLESELQRSGFRMIWIFVPAGCHIFFRRLGCLFGQCCSDPRQLRANIFAKQRLSNLGMVQALTVRCVHRTISRATLLSTARLVQKGAQHLMVRPHLKTANVKLASSLKRTESGSLTEKEV